MIVSRIMLLSLISSLAKVLAFRGALLVSNGWGFNDLQDVPNSFLLKDLPNGLDDFTVAAADSNPSYLAFLTGNLQLATNSAQLVPAFNLHGIFNDANISTAHFGLWNFTNQPSAKEHYLSQDPIGTINAAINYINSHATDSYMLTLFLPYVDVAFLPISNQLQNVQGVNPNSPNCKDVLSVPGNSAIYKNCPRQIHIASKIYEDQLLHRLISILNKQNAFTFWSAAHGALSPHTHSNSAPRTKLRGSQYSLYDGGIRTPARVTYGQHQPFLQQEINAIDLLPSLLALANIRLSNTVDGISLFSSIPRSRNLQWFTPRTAEGDCVNTSPQNAIQITQNNIKYKVLYDAQRTEVYPWNNGYEKQSLDLTIPNLPSTKSSNPKCGVLPATGITRNLSNSKRIKGIINILGDDLGYDFSFVSGHPSINNYPRTPNLDQLAKSSLYFNNYRTAATVCSPTRASIMSARNPSHEDVQVYTVFSSGKSAYTYFNPYSKFVPNQGVPPYLGYGKNISTITSFFKNNGWSTAHFGKWHLSGPSTNTPSYYGIDYYKCYACNGPVQQLYPESNLYFPGFASELITNDSLSWMSTQLVANKSFYINIWYQTGHAPLNTLPNEASNQGFPNSANPYITLGESMVSDNQRPLQTYASLVNREDQEIGRIVRWLESEQLDEEVVVVYSTDNGHEHQGMYFNSVGSPGPHRGGKRSNYDGGTHVPMIMRWGSKLNGITDIPFTSVDLYPTLAAISGLNPNAAFDASRFDGMDHSPCLLFSQCDKSYKRASIWESRYAAQGGDCLAYSPRYAVMQDNMKLYLGSYSKETPKVTDQFSRIELYNVTKDPLEYNEISALYPNIVSGLKTQLFSYQYFVGGGWFKSDIKDQDWTYTNPSMYVGLACV